MDIDTKRIREIAVEYHDFTMGTLVDNLCDEIDQLRRGAKMGAVQREAAKKLKIAAESAAEVYTAINAPDPDLAGTFIVATTEYERLDELLDAAVACREAITACEEESR